MPALLLALFPLVVMLLGMVGLRRSAALAGAVGLGVSMFLTFSACGFGEGGDAGAAALGAGLPKTPEIEDQGRAQVATKASRSQHSIRDRMTEQIIGAGGAEYDIMARPLHGDAKAAAISTAKANLAKSGFERVERPPESGSG